MLKSLIVSILVHVELGSTVACEIVKNVNLCDSSVIWWSCIIDVDLLTYQLTLVIPCLYNNTSLIVVQESKITCFHEGIGICDQLMGIPIPLAYTRLTSRFLVLWHLTLPIILWDDCHWIVVPATFISAASLFCIEEVWSSPLPWLLDYLMYQNKLFCNLLMDGFLEGKI